jgi:Ca2+-binding EF-hand superfamily protein
MFDHDQTGKVEFQEFCALWGYINTWRGIFQNYDRDRSGYISNQELKSALNGFGFQVSDNLIRLLVWKFDRNGNQGNFE